MLFSTLLGNQRIKDNLRASLARNRLSHFYLISGPAGAGKHTLARLLAAAILCRGVERPCGDCPACRKVMNDSHPDFITVTDPEHKNIPVAMVRQVREDMFVRPNESEKKIYLFPQSLGIEGQNALLKILEEPPSYGVFMLLTENPETLLPTVRSRCVELKLEALPETILRSCLAEKYPDAESATLTAAIARSGGYLGQAISLMENGAAATAQTQGFVKSFALKDPVGLLQTLVPMEKWRRDVLLEELSRWAEIAQQALTYRSGGNVLSPLARKLGSSRSAGDLLQAVKDLRKSMEYLQGNISPAAVCGYLEWALR